jgi:hypothetical protein
VSRRKVHRMPGHCAHGHLEHHCPRCARRQLEDLQVRVHLAIRAGRRGAVRDVAIVGGTPSWEPINLQALTLEQDIEDGGGVMNATDSQVLSWRNRAALIIGDAFAPFPVMREDDHPDPVSGVRRARQVRCPTGHCTGRLLVHRDSDPDSPTYARVRAVTCERDQDHTWEYSNGGFLRLRVALGA